MPGGTSGVRGLPRVQRAEPGGGGRSAAKLMARGGGGATRKSACFLRGSFESHGSGGHKSIPVGTGFGGSGSGSGRFQWETILRLAHCVGVGGVGVGVWPLLRFARPPACLPASQKKPKTSVGRLRKTSPPPPVRARMCVIFAACMMPTHLRFRRRSFLGLLFLFSLSTSALYFIYSAPGIVNEYVFMVQARGLRIRENVRNIGAQVLEQVVRGAYNNTDYAYDFNVSESDAPPTTYLPEGFTFLPSQVCPERLLSMKGKLEVNMSEVSLEEVEKSLLEGEPTRTPGGYWKPTDCLPRWKVAILVPFRNRHEHLPILLRHLVPVLKRQRLQFAFYFIEQGGTEPFNRAMLFNVGYKEAMKDLDWDCLVFHDVDHLMENDRNYYGCTDMPRHFAVKLDKYSYMLPYNEFFGGVSGMTVKQFKKINGFPNAFWGWGGEDDDLWNRVRYANYNVSRPHGEQGRYMSISRHHRGEVQFLGRYSLLRHSKERQRVDGLNNLNYSPLVSRRPLYTNITVRLSRELAPVADY